MKVFEIRDQWAMENLQPGERPVPEVLPGTVLLRMKAASLNYRDLLVPLRGYGAQTGELPLIPVSDGVEGVTRVAVGDRVCPIMAQTWISGPPTAERLRGLLGGPIDGVMAEYMRLGEQGVVKVPAHLSDEQAATLPCAALTAWSAMVTEGRIQAGETVLLQGTGGVSLFALQFAKAQGARVILLSSSEEKLAKGRQLGADEGINYREIPEWGRLAREMAGGEGVDHIVELGGQQTLGQSLRAIRTGGTISLIGVLSGNRMDIPLGPVVTRQIRMQGISVGNRDGFEAMVKGIAQHRIQPVVDSVFAFDDLHQALDHLKAARHFGKICLRHE
ncbi:MAG TPA: NAD(P)-dependent alcohol dehydrogenase [Rhodocyclaceae bacterium]|nr:NAD(P)-dependent alcohol dehydrogenase [Rhodocyclaceae bacterium]